METEETSEAENKDETKEEKAAENGVDSKPPYSSPVRCDITVGVAEIEWQTDTTDNNLRTTTETDMTQYKKAPLRISRSCVPTWYQKKLDDTTATVQEVFPDDEAWTQIRTAFDLKKLDPTKHILKYAQPGKEASYYYMNPVIRNLVLCNKELLKKSRLNTGGQKMMKGVDQTDKADLTSTGFHPVIPFVNKRMFHVTKAEMIMLLEETTVPIEKFSDKLQKDLLAIKEYCSVFFLYEPKGKNADPKCCIIQRRDKFTSFIKDTRSFNHKGDKYHCLRICGVDPTHTDDDAGETKAKEEEEAMATE